MKQYVGVRNKRSYNSPPPLDKDMRTEYRIVDAKDRRQAVRMLIEWFKGKKGAFYVNDFYREVEYSEAFDCSDLKNNYLAARDIERVIEFSDGELTNGRRYVFRRTRGRTREIALAPNLYRNSEGFYYRVTVGGKRKRIKLSATSLEGALLESKSKEPDDDVMLLPDTSIRICTGVKYPVFTNDETPEDYTCLICGDMYMWYMQNLGDRGVCPSCRSGCKPKPKVSCL